MLKIYVIRLQQSDMVRNKSLEMPGFQIKRWPLI